MEETGSEGVPKQPETQHVSETVSRTKRSILEGDNSDNDEEYASTGFYVREKAEQSESKNSDNGLLDGSEADSNIKDILESEKSEIDKDKASSDNEVECQEESNSLAPEDVDVKSKLNPDLQVSEDVTEKSQEEKDVLKSENDEVTSQKDIDPLKSDNGTIDDSEAESNIQDVLESDRSETDKDVDKASDNEIECPKEPNSLAPGDADVKSQSNPEPQASEDTEVNSQKDKETEASDNVTEKSEEEQDVVKSANNDVEQQKDFDPLKSDGDLKEPTIQVTSNDKDESPKDTVIETEPNASKKDIEKSKDIIKKEDGILKESEMNDQDGKKDIEAISILKNQLTKEEEPQSETKGSEDAAYDPEEMEVEVDFDPSLLCPDIYMDVDEANVVTGNATDGSTDDLLVARTADVDEITGVEVQFNLTHEEMELRNKMYGPENPVHNSKIHCTACNVHLGSALDGQANRFVHPLLKVLICKNCYHFYTSGEFEKDEDGSELYCRWCGQGGEVLCCSSCEFVFCKRCIRNNFGMKKFREIRNSDDWNCFRCDMTQLQALRASCAEFWEYYRTQLAKASTMAQKDPTFTTTDYTKCCNQEQKIKDQAKTAAVARKRKRRDSEDPDFVPEALDEPKKKVVVTPPNAVPTSTPGILVIRPSVSSSNTPLKPIIPGSTALGGGQMFRVGNTTFRPRTSTTGLGYTVTRPKVSSSSSSPGYIKILPQRMVTPRSQTSYSAISGSTKPTFTTIRPTASPRPAMRPTAIGSPSSNVPHMKHEWFEKTVRAAARVNSNLSYTLTQLNRQQSQANSVESLAVVHNKLQEVLSTSINSLIQIRKNLRTEFIAGIKNIKFPSKTAQPVPPAMTPLSLKNRQVDDDVIIVSPTLSPTEGKPAVTSGTNSALVFGPSISLTSVKKTQVTSTSIKPTSSITPASSKSGGYLKVKSFSALQSVPSECITIPDDPPMVLDDKTGLIADPLELCQVDMNDEENSNQSQQSQKSLKNNKESFDDKSQKIREIAKTLNEVKAKEKDVTDQTTENNLTSKTNGDKDVNAKNDSFDKNDKEIEINKIKTEKIENIEKDSNSQEKVIIKDEKITNNSDVSHETEESDPLSNFTYNTTEAPTAEVKKWLDATVLIKKSRVVDEIVRAKSKVLNGDCNSEPS